MKMKLWKKAVALLLGSTLLFGMTACGESSPASSTADSGDTVKVWFTPFIKWHNGNK